MSKVSLSILILLQQQSKWDFHLMLKLSFEYCHPQYYNKYRLIKFIRCLG